MRVSMRTKIVANRATLSLIRLSISPYPPFHAAGNQPATSYSAQVRLKTGVVSS
jgi:hypothetical protein